MTGAGRTGANAGRHPVLLWQVLVIDAVHTESTFLHHPRRAIHLTRAVGACPGAEAAPDAGVLVDQYDTVLGPFVTGACRADGDAGRIFAMQAGFGKMHDLRGAVILRFDLEAVDTVEKTARRLGAIGI